MATKSKEGLRGFRCENGESWIDVMNRGEKFLD